MCISGWKLEVCVCREPEFVSVEGCESAATLQCGGEDTEPSPSKDSSFVELGMVTSKKSCVCHCGDNSSLEKTL